MFSKVFSIPEDYIVYVVINLRQQAGQTGNEGMNSEIKITALLIVPDYIERKAEELDKSVNNYLKSKIPKCLARYIHLDEYKQLIWPRTKNYPVPVVRSTMPARSDTPPKMLRTDSQVRLGPPAQL